jgi:hypothetical protein
MWLLLGMTLGVFISTGVIYLRALRKADVARRISEMRSFIASTI